MLNSIKSGGPIIQTQYTSNNITIAKANDFILDGKFNEAINLYEISLTSYASQKGNKGFSYILHPKSYLQQIKINKNVKIDPIIGMALCYSMSNNYQNGQKFFQDHGKNFHQSSIGILGLAILYSLKGHNNKAIQLYLQIYQKHSYKKSEALQLLIFSYFSQGDDEKSKYYLNQIPQLSNPQIKALSNFYKQSLSPELKVANIELLADKNITSNYFIFKIRLLQLSKEQIINFVQSYNKFLDQNIWIREFLFLNILRIYGKKENFTKLLEYSKLLHENDKENSLYIIYLAFAQINNNNYAQGLLNINRAYQSLTKNDIPLITKKNKHFLLLMIKDLLKLLAKSKFTIKSYVQDNINKTASIFYSIFHKRDDNINSKINKARFSKNSIFQIISTMRNNNFQIVNISKFIYQHYKKKEDNLGFIYLFFSKYICNMLKKSKLKLSEIQTLLEKTISQFIYNSRMQQKFTPETSQRQKIKYKYDEYTIKYNPKITDLFTNQYSFNNHRHLSITIQNIIKNHVKLNMPAIDKFISDIKKNDQIHAFDIKRIEKCTDINRYIQINQIIEELMPEIKEYKAKFLQDVEAQLELSSFTNLNDITMIMLKQWEKLITKLLQERKQKKKALKCGIEDWITVELTFTNHIKLVNCLQFIQSWRNKNKYEIVNIRGDLRYPKQEVVNVVLNIRTVNITIKLMVDSEQLIKRKYQLQLEKLKKGSLGLIFANLINLNKKSTFSPFQYLQQAKQYYQNSKKPEQINISNDLYQFCEGISFVSSFDKISMYQKRAQSLSLSSQIRTKSQSSQIEEVSIEDSGINVNNNNLNQKPNFQHKQIENKKSLTILQYTSSKNNKTLEDEDDQYGNMAISQVVKLLLAQKKQKLEINVEKQKIKQQFKNIQKNYEQKCSKITQNNLQLQKIKETLFRKQQNNSELIKKIMMLENKLKDFEQLNKNNETNMKIQALYQQQIKQLQSKNEEIQSIKVNHTKQIQLINQNNQREIEKLKQYLKAKHKKDHNQITKKYETKQIQLLNQIKKQKIIQKQSIINQYQKMFGEKVKQIYAIKEFHTKQIETLTLKKQQQIQEAKSNSLKDCQQLKINHQIKQKQFKVNTITLAEKYENQIKNIKNKAKNSIQQKNKHNKMYTQVLDSVKQEIGTDNYDEILEKIIQLKKQSKNKEQQIIQLIKQKNKQKAQNNNNNFQTPNKQKTIKKFYHDENDNDHENETSIKKQKDHEKQNMRIRLQQVIQSKKSIQKQNLKIKDQLQSIRTQMTKFQEEMKQFLEYKKQRQMNVQQNEQKYKQKIVNAEVQLKSEKDKTQLVVKKLQNTLKVYEQGNKKIVILNNKNQWFKIVFGLLLFLAIGFNSILHLVK